MLAVASLHDSCMMHSAPWSQGSQHVSKSRAPERVSLYQAFNALELKVSA